MAEVHLIVGYMGFGKTTLAKKRAEQLPAVRLTHDDFMRSLFGWNLPEEQFRLYQEKVSDLIWKVAAEIIRCGGNVVLDYGFWTRKQRREAFERARKLTSDVVFDNVSCDFDTAKARVLKRTAEDDEALYIDENCFDKFKTDFEPLTPDEGYRIVSHDGC